MAASFNHTYNSINYTRPHFSHSHTPAYAITNKNEIVWIEAELIFHWGHQMFTDVFAPTLCCFHDLRNFASVRCAKIIKKEEKRLFHGVTNYGRVWRKGAEKPGLERVKHSECLVIGWGGGGGGRDMGLGVGGGGWGGRGEETGGGWGGGGRDT